MFSQMSSRMPPRLEVCRGCQYYIRPNTDVCPYCGGDVRALAIDYKEKLSVAMEAKERVEQLLRGVEPGAGNGRRLGEPATSQPDESSAD